MQTIPVMTKDLKHMLEISQNKLIRVILGFNWRALWQLRLFPVEASAVKLQLSGAQRLFNNRAPQQL